VLKKIDLLVAEIAWMCVSMAVVVVVVAACPRLTLCALRLRASVAQRTVVTVAFDTFTRLRPVFHGDFVRLEGRALSINKSSVVCQASVYRRDWASGEFQLTHNAIVTFVAIDARGRASGGLPELFDPQRPVQCRQLRDLAEKRKELSVRWREAQEDVRSLATTQRITHAMIPVLDGDGAMPARLVDIQDTVIETRNNFLLKHANLNRNVFGGVLLDWMVHGRRANNLAAADTDACFTSLVVR
jgi:acyl-CoA hydrolase